MTFSHVDESGAARMVDVSGKDVTARTATASGRVLVSPDVVALLRGGGVPKGDALAVARIAGIQAAKRTPDLVPLCHPIAIHAVEVDLQVTDDSVLVSVAPPTKDQGWSAKYDWQTDTVHEPSTPLAVELGLLKVVPEKYLLHAHHWLILHGRYVCKARKPECWRCVIREWCRFEPKTPAPKGA